MGAVRRSMWVATWIGCAGSPGVTRDSGGVTRETAATAVHSAATGACDLPLEECEAEGCETLDATPHAVTGGCATATGPSEPVACRGRGRVCGHMETWGRAPGDAAGVCWRFQTTCQPEGWVACDTGTPSTTCP